MGTCVPPEILGVNGIVSLKHPLIRSLSLITDGCCRARYFKSEYKVNLSAFCWLRSLTWKAPDAYSLDALFTAIQSNAAHLQKLELDFVDWPELWCELFDAMDYNANAAQTYFAVGVFGTISRSPSIFLPEIRTLVLSQVPVVAWMAQMINFGSLAKLTLRRCPGWETLLDRIVEIESPIKLTSLEIQETDETSWWTSLTLLNFIGAFQGLEELFISRPGPDACPELWDCIACRHTTLKRLVQQQNAVTDKTPPYFEWVNPIWDFALFGRDLRCIRDDPSLSPLAGFDLEFLGIACPPNAW